MSRVVIFVIFVLLSISVCVGQSDPAAQTTAAQTTATQAQNSPYALIPTMLAKSLDSKKLKEGDEVTAKTTVGMQGKDMVIPKGATVMGHITQAQARSKGDAQTSLGITFDKVALAGGKWLPIHGLITAVGANPNPEVTTGAAGGGTIAASGAEGNTVPGPGATVGDLQSTNPDLERRKLVNPKSTGVFGIKNLQLDKDAVLVSSGKDLKLETGTQLIIRAEIQPPGQ